MSSLVVGSSGGGLWFGTVSFAFLTVVGFYLSCSIDLFCEIVVLLIF